MSDFPKQIGNASAEGSISFQLFDVDVRDDFNEDGGGGRPSGPRKCKVLLSGRSMDGTSVFVCVKNFRPWFLVGLRDEEANIVDPENYGYQIIQEIYDVNENMTGKKYSVNYHPTYFFEQRYHLYGWRGDEKTKGKTTKKFPWWTMCCPTIAGRRFGADKFKKSRSFSMVSETFEDRFDVWGDDIEPEIQFLIHLDLRANGWVTVPLKNISSKIHTWASNCEIVCDINEVKGNPNCDDIAPFRIVSWDGEMFSFFRDFPKPVVPENAVMNMGSSTAIFGNEDHIENHMFNLHDVGGPIENVSSRCFDNEAHLLLSWRQWAMEQFDVDIMIGFNVRGFDWPFCVGRAKLLGIENQFCRWSKLRIDVCTLKEDNTKSNQMGSRESFKWTRTFGVLDLDMLMYFHRNHKLRSYKLDDIAYLFLKEQKIDLTPAKMWSNFATPSGRRETAIYCVQDCVLPLKLAHKCQVLIQNIEMSRLTFTFLEDLQSRGQQIKIKHQLAYFCNRDGYVMNAPDESERQNMQSIKGATVVEPDTGYYVDPITTLDFTSLYPSIMQAWNLCWSSYIMKKHYQKQLDWPGAEYGRHFIPEKNVTHIFVLHHQSLAKTILEELLSARRRAKKEMAAEDDPFKKSVLNGRQLALKVSANSIYGYTAAVASNVYACSYIGETVTARGREMIEQTKNLSEQNYPAELIYQDVPGGPPENLKGRKAKVIYGDTDSVMVKLPVTADQDGLDLSIKWGPIMATDITKTFRPPINLEFEKVYKPFYLMKKKRYVGKKYELVRGVVAKPYIESKGTPDVRRDTFIVTSNLLKNIKIYLFDKEDPEGAKRVVREEMEAFMSGQVPFEQFILSKSMKAIHEYKNPRGEVHLAVVKKMQQRNPGSEPRGGDRVNYVIIYSENRQLKQCEKSEDPIYAQEHKLKLDLTYYLEHKIEISLVTFYETFDPNIATYMASCKLRLEDEMSGALKFEISSDENVKRGAPAPMKKRKIKNTTNEKIAKPLDGIATTQIEKGVSKTAPPPARKSVNKNKQDESANKTFKTFGSFVVVKKK